MTTLMIAVFLAGYLAVTLEHNLKINKAGIALFTAVVLWTCYTLGLPALVPDLYPRELAQYLDLNPALRQAPLPQQSLGYILNVQIVEALGEISETLFFLIGAMTIVELIDVHGGFRIITDHITTRNRRKLLWLVTGITFFMSAVLDNMTTAIVMVTLLKGLVPVRRERWLFAGTIIIAANSGGAWSPIGDVTTIMLWVKGNITSQAIAASLLLPCLVSTAVPALLVSTALGKGSLQPSGRPVTETARTAEIMTRRERTSLLVLGIACLVSIPVFKSVTHLPPFMGIIMALGITWIYTDILYRRKITVSERLKCRVSRVLNRIDTPTILFFLGILLAVAALEATGILGSFAGFLNEKLHDIYIINLLIGALSSIVDNVPLVAAATGMYPLTDPTALAASADPGFLRHFVQDGNFWTFLAYCAGVGGSLLVIGSVAGVVVMGIEKITFAWYLRRISLYALLGYLAGAGVFLLQTWLRTGSL